MMCTKAFSVPFSTCSLWHHAASDKVLHWHRCDLVSSTWLKVLLLSHFMDNRPKVGDLHCTRGQRAERAMKVAWNWEQWRSYLFIAFDHPATVSLCAPMPEWVASATGSRSRTECVKGSLYRGSSLIEHHRKECVWFWFFVRKLFIQCWLTSEP